MISVPVETGYALTSTVNLVSGTFWTNVLVPNTSLTEIGFKLTNDAWPGLATYVGLGTSAVGSTATITILTIRSLGSSGNSAWSNSATLRPGTSIPSGSEWTVECYDDNDNNPNQYDAFGSGISFSIPGSPNANPISTITLSGQTNFVGPAGTSGNSFYSGLSPLTKTHNMGIGVRLLGGTLTSLMAPTWAGEARLLLRNSALPSQHYEVQLSSLNDSYLTAPLPTGAFRPWLASSATGATLPVGSSWSIEAFDDFDDGPGPDSIGTGISFDILAGEIPVFVQDIPISSPKNLVDAFPDPNNGSLLAVAALNPALANFVGFTGSYSKVAEDNWASDTVIAITNSAIPGRSAFIQPFTSIGNVPLATTTGVLSLTGNLVGSSIPAGSQYRLEFSDDVPSLPTGAVEAILMSATVTLYSSVPLPSAGLNGTLIVGGPAAFSYPRPVSYSIVKGTQTIASGTIDATGSSTPFSIFIPTAQTGAAVIIFDGGSYLRRRVSISMNGGVQSIGGIALQNGDIDQSGEVDATDLDAVISSFGMVGNVPANVDANGEVDAEDLNIVIQAFGSVDE